MSNEEFFSHASSLVSPLDDFYSVANPADMDAPLPQVAGKVIISRAVYIGGGPGKPTLEVVTKDGRTVILNELAKGVWHAIRISRINSAGTTATNILVGW